MRTEAQEQEQLMTWAWMHRGAHPELLLLFHIPNGGRRDSGEAAHLMRLGVKKGVPDLFLPVARRGFHGLFVEMKREKGGRISEEQAAWLKDLNEQGYAASVCNGFDEAKDLIERYLGL